MTEGRIACCKCGIWMKGDSFNYCPECGTPTGDRERKMTRRQRIEDHAGRILAAYARDNVFEYAPVDAKEAEDTLATVNEVRGAIEWATLLVDEIDKLDGGA